jgi:DNA-binding FadR family transcriptional regulator
MLTPVPRQSLSEAVFDQLRSQILSGRLEAGATLPSERLLCKLLKVNRGAVREALKRLDQARLIKVQHGGTTRVLDFLDTAGTELLGDLLASTDGTIDVAVARSMLEMRAAIAPDLARLCALRGGAPAAAALAAVIAEMEAAGGDPDTLHRLVFDYWSALVHGSQNVAYRLLFNSLRRIYVHLEGVLSGVLLDELSDLAAYRAIARAVGAGDAEDARKRAARLVQRGADRLGEVLDALERAGKRGRR